MDIMPGSNDPANFALPQQVCPYLFPSFGNLSTSSLQLKRYFSQFFSFHWSRFETSFRSSASPHRGFFVSSRFPDPMGRNNIVFFWFSALLFGKEAQKHWVRSACFIPIYFRVAIFAMDEGPGLGLKRRKRFVEQKESIVAFTFVEDSHRARGM